MFAVGDADCGVSGPVGNSKRYEINKSDPSLQKKRYKTGKQNWGLRPRSSPILELDKFGNTRRHHKPSTQQVHHASRDASREKRHVDSLVERRTGHLFIKKYREIPPPLNYEIKIFLCPIQLSRQTGPFSGAYLKGLRW